MKLTCKEYISQLKVAGKHYNRPLIKSGDLDIHRLSLVLHCVSSIEIETNTFTIADFIAICKSLRSNVSGMRKFSKQAPPTYINTMITLLECEDSSELIKLQVGSY